MSNLFSVFDPHSIMGFPLNWVSSMCVILILPSLYWMTLNQSLSLAIMIINFVYNEFLAIVGKTMIPGSLLLYLSVFLFISLNNFFGLIPYIFTASSHLTFSVALAVPLWIGHTAMAWMKSTNLSLAHLVPTGTPYPLMPFMVLIELISNVIRPLTLSVRLAANMVAGHLLLTLLSANSAHLYLMFLMTVLASLTLLCILETAVALIQAYVFSVLSTLYLNEVNSHGMNH